MVSKPEPIKGLSIVRTILTGAKIGNSFEIKEEFEKKRKNSLVGHVLKRLSFADFPMYSYKLAYHYKNLNNIKKQLSQDYLYKIFLNFAWH